MLQVSYHHYLLFYRVTTVCHGSGVDVLVLGKAMLVPVVSCYCFVYSIVYEHISALFLALTSLIPFLFAVSKVTLTLNTHFTLPIYYSELHSL